MVHVFRDSDCLSRPPKLPTVSLGDEQVFYHKAEGQYVFLDPVGARIWELLKEERTFSELIEILLAEFEVEAGQCRTDVCEFLEMLQSKKLVTVRPDV